jgi:hypothetical protein
MVTISIKPRLFLELVVVNSFVRHEMMFVLLLLLVVNLPVLLDLRLIEIVAHNIVVLVLEKVVVMMRNGFLLEERHLRVVQQTVLINQILVK